MRNDQKHSNHPLHFPQSSKLSVKLTDSDTFCPNGLFFHKKKKRESKRERNSDRQSDQQRDRKTDREKDRDTVIQIGR